MAPLLVQMQSSIPDLTSFRFYHLPPSFYNTSASRHIHRAHLNTSLETAQRTAPAITGLCHHGRAGVCFTDL
jgi:hypothetical protein